MCQALFINDRICYAEPDTRLKPMFDVFDKNKDGRIDRHEFQFCWKHWIKRVPNINKNTIYI